jgi:ABC-type nitrate/sulfonate/bicarbonate transport system substrate-binding protein
MIDEPASPAPGMPNEEEVRAIVWRGRLNSDTGQRTTSELFALIRPAFEASERDAMRRETRALAQAQDWRNEAEKAERRALSAEAKLAQAVEALRKQMSLGSHRSGEKALARILALAEGGEG